MKTKVLGEELKKMCLNKIMASNLHLGGSEKSCVVEMQSFVSFIKQNTCVLDLKFFNYYFYQGLRFLVNVSKGRKKVFFLGLPLGIEKPFMKVLKKLNEFNRLKSFVIKKKITGILTNFRKLKFRQKLEGVTLSILKKRKKWFLIKHKKNFYLKPYTSKTKKRFWKRLQERLRKKYPERKIYPFPFFKRSKKKGKFIKKVNKKPKGSGKKVKFKTATVLPNLKKQNLDFKTRPALIFVFQPLEHKDFLEKLSKLNIPIMGFVNTTDPINYYDFPIPANTNSLKGSLFTYNIFNQLFRFTRVNPKKKFEIKNVSKTSNGKSVYQKKGKGVHPRNFKQVHSKNGQSVYPKNAKDINLKKNKINRSNGVESKIHKSNSWNNHIKK